MEHTEPLSPRDLKDHLEQVDLQSFIGMQLHFALLPLTAIFSQVSGCKCHDLSTTDTQDFRNMFERSGQTTVCYFGHVAAPILKNLKSLE